jgi:hypothetical protein
MSNIKNEDEENYTHKEYQLVLAKEALRDYLRNQNWVMAVTLTADRPCLLREFLRDVVIFFTQLDKKTYGRSLLDKNDSSNRLQQLHPDANKLWEIRARLGLEKNKKGYMNGLRRIVMIERAEVGQGKKKKHDTWEAASGIKIKLKENMAAEQITEWTQTEAAGSNKRKVTSLQDTNIRAWWHLHFLMTDAADCEELTYNKQFRRIQRIWAGMREKAKTQKKAGADRRKFSESSIDRRRNCITGSCYVERIRDKEHSGRCVNYITKHIKTLSWNTSVVDHEVTDGYWLDTVSNMGTDKGTERLKEVREALNRKDKLQALDNKKLGI